MRRLSAYLLVSLLALAARPSHAAVRAIMEGIPASNHAVLIDTTNAQVDPGAGGIKFADGSIQKSAPQPIQPIYPSTATATFPFGVKVSTINLTSGTTGQYLKLDASGNVVTNDLLGGSNAFTGPNTFGGPTTLGGTTTLTGPVTATSSTTINAPFKVVASTSPTGYAVKVSSNDSTDLFGVFGNGGVANPVLDTYWRPIRVVVDGTHISVPNNTGVANQTCIWFHDGDYRCVTEVAGPNAQYREIAVSSTAVLTGGAYKGGMRSGETLTNNTWMRVFAEKLQDSTTAFVLVLSTWDVTQANYAQINTNLGTNQWVNLGLVAYGDNSATANALLTGNYTGNLLTFSNVATGNVLNNAGIRLATTASAGSLAWAYASGMGAAQVPPSVTNGLAGAAVSVIAAGTNVGTRFEANSSGSGNNRLWTTQVSTTSPSQGWFNIPTQFTGGFLVGPTSSTMGADIYLNGVNDNTLGLGANPQL